MNFKAVKEETTRIRLGYRPKSKSFWIWTFYGINGALSLIMLRIRMMLDDF